MNPNGTLNGNGSHGPNGLLNGNGSLREPHAKPRQSRLKNWITSNSDAFNGILVYGVLAILIGSLTLWNHYHPQPPPPVDPRIEQVKKTISNLYDAIDVLQDELPPQDNDPPGFNNR